MLYIKQLQNWCKAHWKWLTLLVMFVVAYVFGKNQSKNLLKMAELERNQYKEQNKNLAQEVNKKAVKDKEAIKRYEETAALLRQERDLRLKKIEGKEAEDILKELGIEKR